MDRFLTLKVVVRRQKFGCSLDCRSSTTALKTPLLCEQQYFNSLVHWINKRHQSDFRGKTASDNNKKLFWKQQDISTRHEK